MVTKVVSNRTGFLSLLFILKDKHVQNLVEYLYTVHDMNDLNIGSINYCLGAETGLREYKFSFPDIVFIQIELADKSGFDVLQEVKKDNPKAFVVMIGSDSSPQTLKKVVELGAKGYVLIPFSANSINQYIPIFFKDHFTKDKHAYGDDGQTN